MISFITGIPGNGKSLFVVSEILPKYRKFQGRKKSLFGPCKDIFKEDLEEREVYTNIIGLSDNFGCKELTLEEVRYNNFSNIPDGSVIIIDEAWEFFPTRTNGSNVPNYVEFFATHRHKGLDFYLLTQNPLQVDSFIRKLTENHTVLRRILGREVSSVFESVGEGIIEDFKSKTLKTYFFKYPKCNYELYKSSVSHTHTKNIKALIKDVPLSLKLILLAIICLFSYAISKNISVFNAPTSEPAPAPASSNVGLDINPINTLSESLYLSNEICIKNICIPSFIEITGDSYQILTSEDLTQSGLVLTRKRPGVYSLGQQIITYKKGGYKSQYGGKKDEKDGVI